MKVVNKKKSETASKTVQRRMKNTLAAKPLLEKWINENYDELTCPICGENMPETFQNHHIDGNHKNLVKTNKIKICASCHNITFKADTRLKELWTIRHEKYVKRKRSCK